VYFDATGKVLKTIANQAPPLMFSMVIYDKDNKSYLPIAEFLTTAPSHLNISLYLFEIKSCFERYRAISLKNFKFSLPQIFVTDQSWPLISSLLSVFGNSNISEYLQDSYDLIFNNKKKNKLLDCLIVLCKIHLLKNFTKHSRKIKHQCNDENQAKKDNEMEIRVKKFLAFCFSLLQESESIIEFEDILKKTFYVFHLKR
jgi:hypothetical protein